MLIAALGTVSRPHVHRGSNHPPHQEHHVGVFAGLLPCRGWSVVASRTLHTASAQKTAGRDRGRAIREHRTCVRETVNTVSRSVASATKVSRFQRACVHTHPQKVHIFTSSFQPPAPPAFTNLYATHGKKKKAVHNVRNAAGTPRTTTRSRARIRPQAGSLGSTSNWRLGHPNTFHHLRTRHKQC